MKWRDNIPSAHHQQTKRCPPPINQMEADWCRCPLLSAGYLHPLWNLENVFQNNLISGDSIQFKKKKMNGIPTATPSVGHLSIIWFNRPGESSSGKWCAPSSVAWCAPLGGDYFLSILNQVPPGGLYVFIWIFISRRWHILGRAAGESRPTPRTEPQRRFIHAAAARTEFQWTDAPKSRKNIPNMDTRATPPSTRTIWWFKKKKRKKINWNSFKF